MKKCLFCNEDFKPSKDDVRIKYCSSFCRKEDRKKNNYMKKYYQENKELMWIEKQKTKEYKESKNLKRRNKYANDEEYRKTQNERTKQFYKENPHIKKNNRLKKYNLNLEQFNDLLKNQNNKCAICGYEKKEDKNFFPVVDHCHETNKVRGLLCMNCNMGLGKFFDNINILEKAIKYLKGDING